MKSKFNCYVKEVYDDTYVHVTYNGYAYQSLRLDSVDTAREIIAKIEGWIAQQESEDA